MDSSIHTKISHFFYLTLFIFISIPALCQTGSVKGRVTTSAGEPALFVNIMLKGTTKGAQTNENGEFLIKNVKEGRHTLVASFVGKEPQEIPVTVAIGQQASADFLLTTTAQQLAEVAVTGKRTLNQQQTTIGKIPAQSMDLPQSMTVVGSQVIEDQQANKLSDVIKNVNEV